MTRVNVRMKSPDVICLEELGRSSIIMYVMIAITVQMALNFVVHHSWIVHA